MGYGGGCVAWSMLSILQVGVWEFIFIFVVFGLEGDNVFWSLDVTPKNLITHTYITARAQDLLSWEQRNGFVDVFVMVTCSSDWGGLTPGG